MNFSKKVLKLFRDDLCKDQREIQILPCKESLSGKVMRKYNTSKEEYETEISVINYLLKSNISFVPRIFGSNSKVLANGQQISYVDIEYFDGIRIYNILAYLKKIEKLDLGFNKQVTELKTAIFEKCKHNQKEIQRVLIELAKKTNQNIVYPQQKLIDIVKMLCNIMQLDIHDGLFSHDLPYIIKEFNRIATVPFRDSTTKNMVLYYPKLYLKNYLGTDNDVLLADERRFKEFIMIISNGEYKDLLNYPIIDFDFSTCQYLTSRYDDPIGYSCHEINWSGIPNAQDLVWDTSSTPESKEIAITFIIRFLRFGGRKVAYHIFHPNAYKYRFKYDNEDFYFNNLNEIVCYFWPKAKTEIPYFIDFIEKVARFDKSKIIDNIDEFELEYPNCNRKFYVDIFPY